MGYAYVGVGVGLGVAVDGLEAPPFESNYFSLANSLAFLLSAGVDIIYFIFSFDIIIL